MRKYFDRCTLDSLRREGSRRGHAAEVHRQAPLLLGVLLLNDRLQVLRAQVPRGGEQSAQAPLPGRPRGSNRLL